MLGSEFLTVHYEVLLILRIERQFKVALKRYLNAHSFYSVDEFLAFTDNQ
jgi:hypothetical protein